MWEFFLLIPLVLIMAFILWYILKPKKVSKEDMAVLDDLKKRFSRIDKKYATLPLYEGDQAYTEGKQVISLCLKDPDTGKYYSHNTLVYVLAHEIAHLESKSYGTKDDKHNAEFRSRFSKLLKQAETAGIYNPMIDLPDKYCGVKN